MNDDSELLRQALEALRGRVDEAIKAKLIAQIEKRLGLDEGDETELKSPYPGFRNDG